MTWNQRPRDPGQQRGFDLIGAMIKRQRHSVGWTQRFLEARSGIDQTVISRLENGKQYGLRWSRFADLVDALRGLDGGPSMRLWPSPSARPPEAHDADPVPPIYKIDLGAGLDDDFSDDV